MKVTNLHTRLVKLPLATPISTAIHAIESVGCICLTLETDSGLQGESYIFTINGVRLKVFDEMIRGLAHQVIDRDPHYIGAIWQNIWLEINPSGHKGVTVSAMSAIDTACWDLVAKAAGRPLHHLFGGCRDRIDTYASGGLWLSQSIDELIDQASSFVEQGFKAMKVRVGSGNNSSDIERVRALRRSVGDDIELMADANQALTPKQAIQLARALQEFGVSWLEEPVPVHDISGHAQVTAAVDLNIATGETEYTRYGMQALLDARACDILMPDLQRVGGLSEMLKVAALASARNIPISTHMFTEHSLSIAGSVANCISVEHMPWFAPLFNESMEIEDGKLIIPQRPGTGFTFNQDAIADYAIS